MSLSQQIGKYDLYFFSLAVHTFIHLQMRSTLIHINFSKLWFS